MRKIKNSRSRFLRSLSGFLAVLTVFGLMSTMFATMTLPVFAADEEEEEEVIDYYTYVYNTPEEKLADMELRSSAYGYELYFEDYTGEIAFRDTKTGQVIFSNPYDVAVPSTYFGKQASNDTKADLMSQIIIKYTDNDQEKDYESYTEAAQRGQIVAKNLKNGLRVEYTLGKEETRSLVPRLINAERFETLIMALIDDEAAIKKMNAFYTLKDPNDPKLTVRGVKELQATFPITNTMAVYVFDPYASTREINLIESYIKTYCPEYTFAELDSDHALTEYESEETAPALFKLALEYYINEDGLQVRLPANGIRFDESTYQLTYIQILPFMGAGSYDHEGYTMIPDGSGTIMRFEDFYGQNLTVTGKLYGQDFAFHELSGAHQEIMRMPVYGVVEHVDKEYIYEYTEEEIEAMEEAAGEDEEVETTKIIEYTEDRGFLAIITEGDALANITTAHGGALHKYCTVYTQFYPRPKDSYNLAESISVGSNATWTVVSERKYTGSYRIQYVLLDDKNYDISYYGMAEAYRDYLEKNEIIKPLTDADVKEDIPLYIETFGIIDTQKTILSIPVMVKTPLTTFEDVQTMTNELGEAGVTNLVYRLSGYHNGGMDSSYVSAVKFEKNAGGNAGYADLESFAASKGIEIYPDFDFAYVGYTEFMDGFSYRKDAVKTIDNRYTQKREYDAVYQSYGRTFMNAVSPSVYEKLYGMFREDAVDLGITNISVSTLGSDINSDFDKKDPYNREDAKKFTTDLLEIVAEDYNKVMIDSGNSYTLKYASHILNASIDSSRYYYSSQTIPFVGMVLHGYIPFAGTPTNMAGDIKYETLKMLESGAYPYFTLSYQNTEFLKDSMDLSKYYSISYDIWKEDLIAEYNLMNDALAELQTKKIVGHEFIEDAERVPSAEELKADKAAAAEAEALAAEEEARLLEKEEKAAKLAERREEERIAELLAKGEEIEEEEEEEEEEIVEEEEVVEEGYVANAYTCSLGTVVEVTYEGGTSFILNYNSFQVKAHGKTIDALSFVKID